MTYEEALDVLVNKIQIDVNFTEDFNRDYDCLTKCKEALEKRIPMKPKGKCDNDGYFNAGALCKCPNCDSMVIQNLSTIKTDYCKNCGQAIDWGEE